MKYFKIIVVIFFLISSCNEGIKNDSTKGDTKIVTINKEIDFKSKEVSIKEMINYENGYWNSGIIQINFQENRLDYLYHGQCIYFYPLKITPEKATMLWSNEMDCKIDLQLENKFQISKYPEVDKPFAYFSKLNDSTLNVEYKYKEWVNAYHKNIQTNTFPDTFTFQQYDK